MITLSHRLEHTATTYPERVAVIVDGRAFTYGELIVRARTIAQWLRNHAPYSNPIYTSSSLPRPPVAITAELSLSFIETWWGALIAGVPLLMQHPSDPIERRTSQQELAGVFATIHLSRAEEGTPLSWEPLSCPVNKPTDAAVLIATSGSSGQPKFIPLTGPQLHESAVRVNQRLSVDDESRWLLSLIPSHIGGLSIVVRAAIAGCTLLIPEDLKRTTLHRISQTDAVTHLSLVPSVAEEFVNAGPLPSSLRVILLGGERITERQRKTLATIPACYLSYGATETASCIAVSRLAEIADLADAVGMPIADTSVHIIGEAGMTCSAEEVGIVHVTGPTVTPNTPASATTSPFPTWRSTDCGYLDRAGILHILGRVDDVIVSGGIKVSAQEIVDATLATGLVELAIVVKAPHPRWGEQPILFITAPSTTNASVLSTILKTRLGNVRTPREIVLLDNMPRTAIGKIDRALLTAYTSNDNKQSSPIYHLVREHFTR